MMIITTHEQLQDLRDEQRYRAYVSESLTGAHPIEECGENLVELGRYFLERGVEIVLAPVAPDATNGMFLRTGAAQRLAHASRILLLRTGGTCRFKVTDAFRPLWLQRKYFTKIHDQIREREGLLDERLWEKVTQFIADPDGHPPHTTGGAIDLTILNEKDVELDMGTEVDAIVDQAYTWYRHLSQTARENRQLLFTCMTQAGFVNLASEWWHYSYGDQYWALLTGSACARYTSLKDVSG